MSVKTIAFAAIFFASVARGQTPGVPAAASTAPRLDKVFDFANKPGPQGLQEMATILRTVGNVQQLSIDAAASTLSVHGTSDELAMSGWILHELDRPAVVLPAGRAPTENYVVPGESDDLIRIYHLAHATTPQNVQEILTVLRTVADVQKIFTYTPLTDLVVRAPAVQIALVEYLINSIDIAPASVTTGPEFHYTVTGRPFDHPGLGNTRGTETVRVFYLRNTSTPRGVQEILTVLRTVLDIQKVFNVSALPALAIRGSASDVAASEWVIQSLDVPKDAKPGMREYNIPANLPDGNVVRVFYTSNIKTTQGLAQTVGLIRNDLELKKSFQFSAPAAIVFRGSSDQVAKAEQLIQQRDQPEQTAP